MCLRFLRAIGFILLTLPLRAQYSAIDRHAAKAPDSLARDIPTLVAYLTAPAKSETEKARSLYVWVARYLSYDHVASNRGRRLNQNIEDILRRRRGTCFDYAQLYEALCRYAELNCRMIFGYARPKLDAPVRLQEPDHAWNAVRLDGEWRLLDATWSNAKDEWSNAYGRDYFLPPPELFILNHLPANPVWQLLEHPVDTNWFKLPASRLLARSGEEDAPRFSFRDSIAALLSLSPAEHALREAEAAYQFYPTQENRRFWAHALIDLAVSLDESSEGAPLDTLIEMKAQAIALCTRAAALAPLHNWQKEFHIGLLLDKAVAYNQLEAPQPQLERRYLETSRDLLRQAQAMLEDLPEDSIFRQYAAERCRQFLEVVEYNLERL